MRGKLYRHIPLLLFFTCSFTVGQTHIEWGEKVIVSDNPTLSYAGDSIVGTNLHYLSRYGAEYGRMLKLKGDTWLSAYTVSNNYGYKAEKGGGFELEIAKSENNGRTWKKIGLISDKGRDLDNAQMIQLPDGSILLACRSVRWQESYQLPVYRSQDQGKSWSQISIIDSNEGAPGELGSPDKGVYEPHFQFLDDGRLAVVYANEIHVTGQIPYSQIISQKISSDLGKTWGKEVWAVFKKGETSARPGMPVWTEMKNGSFILVYEICGPPGCEVYFKISENGHSWPSGFGKKISGQVGGPYILSLKDGTLVVTSNKGNVSISEDMGLSWHQTGRPWKHEKSFEEDWTQTIWSSLYQTGPKEIGIMTTVQRERGGHNIQLRIGEILKK